MNEREIRALIREAEAAAKRYKAELNARQPKPKATKAPAKQKTTTPRTRGGAGMRGSTGSLGTGGGLRGSVNK